MIIIGVTGGVGAGKSEILHYMETHYNCRVLLADEAARALEAPGGAIYGTLIRLLEEYPLQPDKGKEEPAGESLSLSGLGGESLPLSGPGGESLPHSGPGGESKPLSDPGESSSVTLPDGRINNPEMARRIFSFPELREKVNALVHPAVKTYILEAAEQERAEGKLDLFVIEAALLIEAGYKEHVDSLWYIYCDETERRRRLRASRGYSDDKIDNILRSQLTEDQFRASVDVVIDNSTSVESAFAQVDEALKKYGCVKRG